MAVGDILYKAEGLYGYREDTMIWVTARVQALPESNRKKSFSLTIGEYLAQHYGLCNG